MLLVPSDIFEESLTADLRVVHHNVQGLLSKFSEIGQWLNSSHGSNIIICCSETWLLGDKLPATSGFVSYCSPLLGRPTGKKPLLGSCMFISHTLIPSHPEICDIVEWSTTCLNVTCRFVTLSRVRLQSYLFIAFPVHLFCCTCRLMLNISLLEISTLIFSLPCQLQMNTKIC